MIHGNLEDDVDSSFSQSMGRRNMVGPSNKLFRLSSVKRRERRSKSGSDGGRSEQADLIQKSAASPNYMKETRSAAAKEKVQMSRRVMAGQSSGGSVKTLTRLSSLKLGTAVNKSRSIRLVNMESSRRSRRAISSNDEASTHNSDLSGCSNYQHMRISKEENLNSGSPGNKSVRILMRKASMKPRRILAKTVSLKSKRSSVRKCSRVSSQFADLNIGKATCSSAIKDSKFPDCVELQCEGDKFEGTNVMKVCPYSYCSLHGHRHATGPPLKRFVSIRRRRQKTQKSMKLKTQPPPSAEHCGYVNTEIQTGQVIQELISDPIEEPTAAGNEERIGCSEQGNGFSQELCPTGEPEINNTIDVAEDTWLEKQKYGALWRLIYHFMVSGSIAEDEKRLPLDKVDEGKQEEDASKLLVIDNVVSKQEIEEGDRDLGGGHPIAGNQETELNQIDAIGLVQEAVDSILRPEIGSRDQSITSSIISDQKLLGKKIGKDGELCISTSANPTEEKDKFGEYEQTKMECKVVQESETRIKPENITDTKEDKQATKEGNILNRQSPKNWSKLKRFILLNKFIKALERVMNFTPRYLSLEPEPDPEKVNPRHQTMEERKNSEEWMLDYALRQVISKLDSAQKKRVTLLVDAFEMVTPAHDTESYLNTKRASSRAKFIEAYHGTLGQSGEELRKGIADGNLKFVLSDKSNPEMISTNRNQHHLGESLLSEQTISERYYITTEQGIAASRAMDTDWNKKVLLPDSISDSYGAIPETSNVSGEKFNTSGNPPLEIDLELTASNRVLDSASREEQTAASEVKYEEAEPEYGHLQGSCSLQECERDCRTDVAHETQLESRNHMRLWHLIYKNMVSNISAKDGTQSLPDGANKEDPITSGSCQIPSEIIQDLDIKHQNAISQPMELRKMKAIKLVKEAIEKILLPEMDDPLSDDQSSSNPQKKLGGVQSSTDPAEDSSKKSQTFLSSHNNANQEHKETVTKVGQNYNEQKPNSWSNLKKLILLNKFIKALEKVKKFDPQEPRYLPLEPDPEAEKVDLKHQNMDDRKSAEEWMIDYALQQVVSQLDPAQKRKVKLLIEAFETVIPTIKN